MPTPWKHAVGYSPTSPRYSPEKRWHSPGKSPSSAEQRSRGPGRGQQGLPSVNG